MVIGIIWALMICGAINSRQLQASGGGKRMNKWIRKAWEDGLKEREENLSLMKKILEVKTDFLPEKEEKT